MLTTNVLKEITSGTKKKDFLILVSEVKIMANDTIFLEVNDGIYQMEALLDQKYLTAIKEGMLRAGHQILVEDYTISDNNNRPTLNIVAFQPKENVGTVHNATPLKSVNTVENNSQFITISALSSFIQDWTLRARVVKKNEINEFVSKKTSRREKLFSITLLDCENELISGSFFGECAERFFNVIEEGKIYLFSEGTITLNDKKFREICNYKIVFNSKSIITLDQNQDWVISSPKKHLAPISEILSKPEKSLVDVIGVVLEISPPVDFTSKKGTILTQRLIKVVDKSNAAIEITLWNEFAKDSKLSAIVPNSTVILAKGLSIGSYNGGVTLSSTKYHTEIEIDPDLPETLATKHWYQGLTQLELNMIEMSEKKERKKYDFPLKTIAELKNFLPSPTDRYEIIGNVRIMKTDDFNSLTYPSCPNCKKKLSDQNMGVYFCHNCEKNIAEPLQKYLLKLIICEFTDVIYATGFNEVAEFLFQVKAQEFIKKNEEEKKEIINKVQLKFYSFSIKINSSNAPDGSVRNEYMVNSASFVNHGETIKKILGLIRTGLN